MVSKPPLPSRVILFLLEGPTWWAALAAIGLALLASTLPEPISHPIVVRSLLVVGVVWGLVRFAQYHHFRRLLRDSKPGVCPCCGYPVDSSGLQRCPECGRLPREYLENLERQFGDNRQGP